MKIFLVFISAALAFLPALNAARLWHDSTNVVAEPQGFEPVIPTLRRGWWDNANRIASIKSSALNRGASKWAAASAVLAFASVIASVWLE